MGWPRYYGISNNSYYISIRLSIIYDNTEIPYEYVHTTLSRYLFSLPSSYFFVICFSFPHFFSIILVVPRSCDSLSWKHFSTKLYDTNGRKKNVPSEIFIIAFKLCVNEIWSCFFLYFASSEIWIRGEEGEKRVRKKWINCFERQTSGERGHGWFMIVTMHSPVYIKRCVENYKLNKKKQPYIIIIQIEWKSHRIVNLINNS